MTGFMAVGFSRRVAVAVLAGAVMALTACTQKDDRVYFEGNYYRGKAKKAGDDPLFFAATVNRVSQSFEGARQAVEYEATRYCIANYGTSRIRWSVGPDTPAEALVVVKDTLTYQGKCNP